MALRGSFPSLLFARTVLGPVSLAAAYTGIIVMAPDALSADVEIVGSVIAGGVECPLFRTTDGRVFALDGVAKRNLPQGTRLRLRGREVAMSVCQQGKTFLVTAILD